MGKDGYSRESVWGDHTNHYDASGKKVGESRESVWGDHTNHYDASGRKVGESRESVWGDHTNHYGASGSKVGESRESIWGDHTNHYDASGRKVGESRDSLWGDQINHSGSWYGGTSRTDELLGGSSSAGSYSDWHIDSLPSYGGGYTSSAPTPRTRWGLVLQHLFLLVAGVIINVVALLGLSVLLYILRSIPRVTHLNDAFTYRTMFGVLLPVVWAAAVVLGAVVSQILFTKNGDRDSQFGMVGLVVGTIALIGFGLAGWIDEWGAVLPAVGGLVGHAVGSIIDSAKLGSSTLSKSLIAMAAVLVLGLVGQQAWLGYASPTTSGRSAEASAPAFKSGDWLVVLASLPKNTKSRSDAAATAAGMKPEATVIDSTDYEGLKNGYWVVVGAKPYNSKKAAQRACAVFDRRPGPTCYPRQIG